VIARDIGRWEIPPTQPSILTERQWNDLRAYVLAGKTFEQVGLERGVTREAVRASVQAGIRKLRRHRSQLRARQHRMCADCRATMGSLVHMRHLFSEALSYLPPWRPADWQWQP
jgi:predicted DNA-binding protein YlxM (UPF0122 family)